MDSPTPPRQLAKVMVRKRFPPLFRLSASDQEKRLCTNAGGLATSSGNEHCNEVPPSSIEHSDAQPLITLSGDLSKGAVIGSTLASHQGLISPRTTLSPLPSTLDVNRKRSRSAVSISHGSVSEQIEAPVNFRQGVTNSRDDTYSVNELYAMREVEERNAAVEEWLINSGSGTAWDHTEDDVNIGIQLKDIDHRHKSENILIPHQLYYNIESWGSFNEVDLQLIRESRHWTDPPVFSPILSGAFKPYQPVSSQAAIEKFERMCRKSDSVASGEASCGTERNSCASIAGSVKMTGGNILKRFLSPPITDISTPASVIKDAVVRSLPRISTSLASKPAHNLDEDPDHIQGSVYHLDRSYSAEDHGALLEVDLEEAKKRFNSEMSFLDLWRAAGGPPPATLSRTAEVATYTNPKTDGARPEYNTPADTIKQINDDCESTIAAENPPAGSFGTPEEPNCTEGTTKPAHARRQVGIARVHIEILSLQNRHRTNKPDDDDTESSGEESDFEDINENGDAGTFDRNDTLDPNQPFDSSEDSSSRSRSNHPNPSGGNNQGESGRGNDNRKPSRQPTACPKAKQQLLRFACPYQAFETSQSCFRQAPRNPEGGCAGIYRLKQHLNRRHMLSYRCQRCWRSFESKRKLSSHEKQRDPCATREMPGAERFMSAENETELERVCSSGSDEETWWNLFQLLIPGMQERDLDSLKTEFWPYYIHLDSFMIPAITFSNASFQPLATGQSTLQTGTPNEYESLDQVSSDSTSVVDTRLFSSTSTPSYTWSVPLLEVPGEHQRNANPQALQVYTPSQSGVASTNSNSAQQSLAVLDQTQLRRNHERLKARNSRAEAENSELRENNRCVRADLGRVDSVLDDLLASEDLPSHVFDKLSEVSEILLLIKSRIR
ncbi:hypothetical protein BKA56DRAFT_580224 [Ilyonectria sp. MPI-CAGE-AT-0026]|nr:hypothetical protein BKA56DRAFT_580224 [Ilyonectria sp. MPI-CAGE-AT-0026]